MPATITLLASTPSRTQFALDQLALSYKSDLPWDQTVVDPSLPEKGDAHPSFSFMFVSDVRLQESGANACEFEVIYQGAFQSSGGAPILPFAQTEQDSAVQSATSSKDSGGNALVSPATVQYYAPTNTKNFFSYNGPATSGFAADPSGAIVIISLTMSDTSYLVVGSIQDQVYSMFSQAVIHTLRSSEVVATKYWSNTSIKQKIFQPFLFDVTGAHLILSVAGVGYTAGNTLTISSGGQSATIVVDSVGATFGAGGGILSFHATANTFTSTVNDLPASGGSGSGAVFSVWYIA